MNATSTTSQSSAIITTIIKEGKDVDRMENSPFDLDLETPTDLTLEAIEEGREIARDEQEKGYSNMDDLKKALEE